MSKALLSIWFYFIMLSSWVITFFVQVIATVITFPFLANKPYARIRLRGLIFRTISPGMACGFLNPLWTVKRIGKLPKLSNDKGRIFMSNHLSNADPFITGYTCLPYEAKYIAKSELFKVPFGGWAMSLAGDLPIYFTKAKGGWGVKKGTIGPMMEKVKTYCKNGINVFVYPEGARSKDGQMRDFKDGAFRTAVEGGIEILPMAINGCMKCWPNKSWKLSKANVTSKFGVPVKTNLPEYKDMELKEVVQIVKGKVRQQIAGLKKELEALEQKSSKK